MRYKTLVETRTRGRERARCENANDLMFLGGSPEMKSSLTVDSFRFFVDHIPVCLLNPSYGKQLLKNFIFGVFPLSFFHDDYDCHDDLNKITFFGGILDVGLVSVNLISRLLSTSYKLLEPQAVNSFRFFVGHIPLCLLKYELWQAVWRIPTLEFSPLSFFHHDLNKIKFLGSIPEIVLPLTVDSSRFVGHIPLCLLNLNYGKQLLENSVFGIFSLLFFLNFCRNSSSL